MRASAFTLIGLGALSHLALGRWVEPAWLMPDVTLIAIIAASRSAATPRVSTVAWAGAWPWLVSLGSGWVAAVGYAAAAGAWPWASSRWDPGGRRVLVGMAAGAELLLGLWWWCWEPAAASMWWGVPVRAASTAAGAALVGWCAPVRAMRDA